MSPLRAVAAASVLLLGLARADPAVAQVAIGGGAAWGWPAYGPYPSYPYGPYGGYFPGAPCAPGLCFDAYQWRSAVRRELQTQELRRELELQGAPPPAGDGIHRAPRYLPPPTPDAQVQPRYRGSGDVRPEFRSSGQPRGPATTPGDRLVAPPVPASGPGSPAR